MPATARAAQADAGPRALRSGASAVARREPPPMQPRWLSAQLLVDLHHIPLWVRRVDLVQVAHEVVTQIGVVDAALVKLSLRRLNVVHRVGDMAVRDRIEEHVELLRVICLRQHDMEPRPTIARVEPRDLLLLGRREPFLDWHLNRGEAEYLGVEASHEADVVCGDVDVMDTGLHRFSSLYGFTCDCRVTS